MKPIQIIFVVLLILFVAFFGVLALQPYDTMQRTLNALMPDGTFESLNAQNIGVFRALFAFLAVAALVKAWLVAARWKMFTQLPARLLSDLRTLREDFRPQPDSNRHLAAMFVIMVCALAARLPDLHRFMLHDEAYTALAFGSSLRAALTDYHLPNNHVLHSVLVYFSTSLFGFAPWAVRLPTFIAGLLIIPAVSLFGARFYNRETGLFAALLAAFSPALVGFATDARGYGLLTLLTLLAFAAADHVRLYRSLFGWALLALLCALGFLTNPVMFFPFGIIFAWLFFENLVAPTPAYQSKWHFTAWWTASGLATAALTLGFYTPIFIYSGPAAVFGNNFVASMPWDVFDDYLPFRILETWQYWIQDVPLPLVGVLLAGVILSFVFYRRAATHRFPLPLAAVIWLSILLLWHRPDPHAKIWGYLNPILLTWAAAGLGVVLRRVKLPVIPSLPRWSLFRTVFALGMAAALSAAGVSILTIPARWADMGPMNRLVLDLKDRIQPNDGILVATPDDSPLWYYARLHGIPNDHFDSALPRQRLLVITNTTLNQTPESVLTERAPGITCAPPGGSVLLTRDFFTVYECLLP